MGRCHETAIQRLHGWCVCFAHAILLIANGSCTHTHWPLFDRRRTTSFLGTGGRQPGACPLALRPLWPTRPGQQWGMGIAGRSTAGAPPAQEMAVQGGSRCQWVHPRCNKFRLSHIARMHAISKLSQAGWMAHPGCCCCASAHANGRCCLPHAAPGDAT